MLEFSISLFYIDSRYKSESDVQKVDYLFVSTLDPSEILIDV